MESRNAFLKSLRLAFFSFQAVGQKLAARLPTQFEHSTIPAIIDDADLERLKGKVDRIRAALTSAEELEVSDAFDRLWMRELRDLLHRAEDVLEEIEFESVRATTLEHLNFELAGPTKERRKRGMMLSFPFGSPLGPPPRESISANFELTGTTNRKHKSEEVSLLLYSQPRESISAKIDRIMETYAEIASDRVALRLEKDDGMRRMEISRVTTSTSLPMGKLHGREKELLRLRQLLIGEDNHSRPYTLISLVGMPGIGKTAILQHLCHDKVVENLFKHRFWVSASQGFDSKEITMTMLSQSGRIGEKSDLSSLQIDLLSQLTGYQLLLVIDDVWIGNSKDELPRFKSHWEILHALLSHAGKGSKVMLTTQNKEISKIMGSDHTVYVKGLSDEHCWEICREKAFGGMHHNKHLILEPKYKYAIKRCKGLPLAAKAVGSFLHLTPKELWVDTLQNLWCEDVIRNEILSFLRVCYNRLPHHLKRCFVYCSLFPKEYIFQKDHLVRLWLGQNFVESEPEPYRKRHLEDVVGKYFNELVNRCLFQQVPGHKLGARRYMMQDHLHELAQFIAFELGEHLRIEGYQLPEIPQRIRHSSLVPVLPYSDNGNLVEFELSKEQYLRTFLFLGNMHACKLHPISIVDNMFWLIRSLRALDLSYTNIKELPTSLSHLIHLRYLSLRNTEIEKLPESICGLFKLQTLDLKDCYALRELPHGIKHLNLLCHLELPKQKLVNIYIPSEIGQLVNLRKLPVFIIGNAPDTCGLEELQQMPNLEEQLHIIGLNHVWYAVQGKRAFLKNKLKLRKLKLDWSCSGGESSSLNSTTAFMVLKELQPGYNLEELAVKGYFGQKFPNWLGDTQFTRLVKVNLKGCGICEKLPSLGQLPLLKHLTVQQLERVQNIGAEFCGRGYEETKGVLQEEASGSGRDWRGEGDRGLRYVPTFYRHDPQLRFLKGRRCEKRGDEGSQAQKSADFTSNLYPANLSVETYSELLPSPPLPSASLPISGAYPKAFPALETLELRKMVNLEEWTGVEEGDFPCLQNLTLSECKKLRLLPRFYSVKTLLIRCCEKLNHFPQMASLRFLNLEGFENMKILPQLSNLTSLEKLEVVDCKQLSRVMNMQHLVSLQHLKVLKCPALCFSADDTLPLTLEDVHIGPDCPMLGRWKPLGFEEIDSCYEGCRKLVKRKYTTGFNNLATDFCPDFNNSLAVDAAL